MNRSRSVCEVFATSLKCLRDSVHSGLIHDDAEELLSGQFRPGAAVSGTVKFGSGASGEWYLDQFGRLGFIPDEGSGKPDQQDIQEFQVEVQKALGGY